MYIRITYNGQVTLSLVVKPLGMSSVACMTVQCYIALPTSSKTSQHTILYHAICYCIMILRGYHVLPNDALILLSAISSVGCLVSIHSCIIVCMVKLYR